MAVQPPRVRPLQAAAAVVVLLAVIFGVAAGAYFMASRAARGQIASRATVVQLCEAGNDFRAKQVVLWVHLVTISRPPPHETAAQRQQRLEDTAAFLAYVRQVFSPRKC